MKAIGSVSQKLMREGTLLACLAALLWATCVQAAVLHVPADLGTIQETIQVDQDYDDDVEGEQDYDADVKGEHGRRSCEDLPPGNAWGLVKRCRAGSSSGIAKGDFNGDTFADLAIGMPEENTPSTRADSGAVIVIYGSANGLTASDPNVPPSQFWSQNSPGIPAASEAGDGFGSALAAGDFNNDGFSDLAIGIPFEDLEATGLRNSGAVIVIFGSAKGLSATDAPVAPQHFDLVDDFGGDAQLFVDEFFGFSLAWGDFDGDEMGDLAIGIPGMSFISGGGIGAGVIGASGAVAVLFGSDRGLSSAGSQFMQQGIDGIANDREARDEFGRALTTGDFNGDTVSDLAVGVPGEDLGTSIQNEGAVAIILGDEGSGLTSVNNRLLDQVTGLPGIPRPANNDSFGSVLTTGDFNGDAISDLVIGVPLKDVNGTDAGGGYVFMGNDTPAGLGGGVQFWNQNRVFPNANPLERKISEAGDQFGGALAAGDFDGDGRSDLAVGVPFEVVTSFRFGSSPTNIDRAGEVDVIYGSANGLSISGRTPQVQHQDQVNIEEDAEILDRFGSSLTAWNFGNGTQADLAIGVPFEDVSGQQDAGAVNVLYGSGTGLTFSRDQLWHQSSPGVPGAPEAGDHFGKALY